MKQYWRVGLVVAVVLAFGAMVTGIVAAQTSDSTPSATDEATATPQSGDDTGDTASDKSARKDEYLDALAENLGVSREALDQALTDTALDMVDKALADGKITQEEADNIKERINSGDFPPIGPGVHFGFGHGFEKGFDRGVHVGVKIDDLADFLGIDIATLHEGLQNGQSLAEIAEANGKTRDELKAHILSNVQDRLDQAVADGEMTQDEADEKLQRADEMVDNMIDNSGPIFRGGPRFHHFGGPGPFGGFDGEDEGEDDSSTPNTETSSLTL